MATSWSWTPLTLDVGLSSQVVDLVWSDLGDDSSKVGGIGQVTVMQEELGGVVRVL